MKIVLFDIDGTLLRTGGAGALAFNKAFEEMYGIRDVWDNFDPSGRTDQEIISELGKRALGYELSHLEKIELGRRYVKYHGPFVRKAPRFRLMPGVPALLKMLAKQNYLLGLATGNFKETAHHKLKRGKINRFFSFGGFGSDSYDRLTLTKRALERGLQIAGESFRKSGVVLIGDARQDIQCGKELGLRTIGVATGSLSTKELSRFKPDLLLENLLNSERILEFIESRD